MTVASETRAAVRARPFLYDALRAGVVNYAAAAAALDLDADPDAVATALRRFGEELDADGADSDDPDTPPADARVTMRRGLGRVDATAETDADPLLAVAGSQYVADAETGDATAVLARGTVDAVALERVLGKFRAEGVAVEAAGVTQSALVVIVGRRHGADALRTVESVVAASGD